MGRTSIITAWRYKSPSDSDLLSDAVPERTSVSPTKPDRPMRLFSLVGFTLMTLLLAYGGAAWQISPPSPVGELSFADTTRSERISRGAELFSRTCQRCHSTRGPAEFEDREWVIITQHMQTRANLTREQARLVRDFLLASNGPAMAPGSERPSVRAEPSFTVTDVTDAMVEQGRQIYNGAGGCMSCHGAELQGGPIAPNLKDSRWKSGDGSLASILETIRNGVSGTAMAAYPGGISDAGAKAAAAYVWKVSQDQIQP